MNCVSDAKSWIKRNKITSNVLCCGLTVWLIIIRSFIARKTDMVTKTMKQTNWYCNWHIIMYTLLIYSFWDSLSLTPSLVLQPQELLPMEETYIDIQIPLTCYVGPSGCSYIKGIWGYVALVSHFFTRNPYTWVPFSTKISINIGVIFLKLTKFLGVHVMITCIFRKKRPIFQENT